MLKSLQSEDPAVKKRDYIPEISMATNHEYVGLVAILVLTIPHLDLNLYLKRSCALLCRPTSQIQNPKPEILNPERQASDSKPNIRPPPLVTVGGSKWGARSDQCSGISKAWGECITNNHYKRYRAPASAGGAQSTRIGHGMYLIRGV